MVCWISAKQLCKQVNIFIEKDARQPHIIHLRIIHKLHALQSVSEADTVLKTFQEGTLVESHKYNAGQYPKAQSHQSNYADTTHDRSGVPYFAEVLRGVFWQWCRCLLWYSNGCPTAWLALMVVLMKNILDQHYTHETIMVSLPDSLTKHLCLIDDAVPAVNDSSGYTVLQFLML